MGLPTFVTRVKVGKGRDMILISVESPAGNMTNGEVESMEAMRFVVSLSTFAEITELFVRTLKTIDPLQLRSARAAAVAGDHLGARMAEQGPRDGEDLSARKH